MFKNLNINPKSRKAGDCVIRAIAKASGKSWHTVFDELTDLARSECAMPNDRPIVKKYLERIGFHKVSVQPKPGCSRFRVKELAEQLKTPAVVFIAGHLTAIDGFGNYIDTWDCGDKCAYQLFALN